MRILLPYDGSEASKNAVNYILNLVKVHKTAEVTILTVACNDAPFARDFVANPLEALNACHDFFRNSLEKVNDQFQAAGINVKTILKTGDAAEEIIKTIKQQEFDKIVMGRRGLSSLSGWVLGSVSAKILANVDIPITLVK